MARKKKQSGCCLITLIEIPLMICFLPIIFFYELAMSYEPHRSAKARRRKRNKYYY